MPNEQFVVLCVDDEPIILRSLGRLLSSAGYRVLVAENGPAGLEIVDKEPVDLIIADQRMPLMTGSEFLRRVHAQYPGIMSIMLSGYSDFDSLVSAVNDGEILRFVSKPWDNQVLLDVVASAVEKRRVKKIADNLVKSIGSMSSATPNVRIETSQNETGVSIRIMEDGKIFTGAMLITFLNGIFDALGISQDERIKMVSGAVSRDQGKVVLFINVGQGVMLNIEIPTPSKT